MVQTLLGLAAATLTTGCWLPQLIRSWRTRSAGDISWLYLLALGTGIALWLVYGLVTGDAVIVLANALTLAAVGLLAAIKARPVAPRERVAP
jgi:MtN3 and saliva related transmembrane protein